MNKKRILILIGDSLANKNTFYTLLQSDLNIVGVVVCNQKKNGINLKYVKSIIKKLGVFKFLDQAIFKIVYGIIYRRKNSNLENTIFDRNSIIALNEFKNKIYTNSYDTNESINFIKNSKPDIIVIHTPYWVSKNIRNIVGGFVLGGHPGLTRYYRGVHSPFWAIYRDDFNKIGYTIFKVDTGIDSGDIVQEGLIKIDKNDSFQSISWKGMKLIAEELKEILSELKDLNDLNFTKNSNAIGNLNIYYYPGITNYLKYSINKHFYFNKKNKL